MNNVVAVGVMTALYLSSVTDAGELYNYSAIAYLDADRTDELFTVTATVENFVIGTYGGTWGYQASYSITDAVVVFAGVAEPVDLVEVYYSQYSRPNGGIPGNPWDDHGYEFSYQGDFMMELTGALEPFANHLEIRELRDYVDVLGTGKVTLDSGTVTDLYTVASMTAPVPGPGGVMIVTLGGAVIGRRRRR